MCTHFRADLTALKRLFHALFVIEQPLLDWFVSIFTMSIFFPFSISVCRQERQPSTNQHEKVSQTLRFPAKHDVWLGTGANILSIGKDACLQLFSRPWTFRLKKPGRGGGGGGGAPQTLIRRGSAQRSKPFPFDTKTEKAFLSYVTFYCQDGAAFTFLVYNTALILTAAIARCFNQFKSHVLQCYSAAFRTNYDATNFNT